jgi:hypothetical protein
MKFLKSDGTIEDGTPLTDEQAAEKSRVEDLLHVILCKNAYHYGWQGIPACKKVSQEVVTGTTWIDALEGLKPKPISLPDPEQEPEPEVAPTQPITVSTTNDDIPF